MAQRRMISKSISTSKKLSKVSTFEALLFTWLIPHCDDYGQMDGDPAIVKGIIIPLRTETIDDVAKALKELEKIQLIRRYKVENEDYLEIVKWDEHQTFKTDRKRVAKYPENDTLESNWKPDGNQVEPLSAQVKLSEVKLSEDNIRLDFEEFWKLYPKHIGKKTAKALWDKLPGETQQKILADIPKRLADTKWIRGFHKDPERYIKHEQWNDDIIVDAPLAKVGNKVDKFTK